MREIRFRGKCIEDCELKGQWLYGHYLKSASHFIAVDQGLVDGHFKLYQVDPKTVGQSTGLKDKNGKEIYEGDIISTDLDRPFNIVVFRNGAFMFQCHDNGKDYYDYVFSVDEESDRWRFGEIIGNIYENPELLKGDENE